MMAADYRFRPHVSGKTEKGTSTLLLCFQQSQPEFKL
jgi:hypothetical protein